MGVDQSLQHATCARTPVRGLDARASGSHSSPDRVRAGPVTAGDGRLTVLAQVLRRDRLFILSVLLASCQAATALAQSTTIPSLSADRPFAAGERFTYTISWLNITAGTAVMEVAEADPVRGRAALRLLTTATSSPLVSKFYPVDNRVESLVDAEALTPFWTVFRRREGKRKNDFEVTFHRDEGTVTVTKDGVTEQMAVPPGMHDSISCLYYFRSLPALVPGSSQTINVHHDKKNYRLELWVEGIERLKGPWGEVEVVRVLAIMPFQGIFLNEGNIRVWLTNDARRVPVMMKAKVMIGSVVAKLVDGFRVPDAP
ncbi:MAG: DUF3108 domain-containing protein [Nitrospirae bacterium]|nr:MAG: DUF3108 domain-containing protein [Nitrospirota bacterium]